MKIPKHCYACKHHQIISDPDPYDWFCDDDSAITCTLKKTDGRTIAAARRKQSKYVSSYSEFKVIAGSLRPYEISKVERPKWCPLMKKTKKEN